MFYRGFVVASPSLTTVIYNFTIIIEVSFFSQFSYLCFSVVVSWELTLFLHCCPSVSFPSPFLQSGLACWTEVWRATFSVVSDGLRRFSTASSVSNTIQDYRSVLFLPSRRRRCITRWHHWSSLFPSPLVRDINIIPPSVADDAAASHALCQLPDLRVISSRASCVAPLSFVVIVSHERLHSSSFYLKKQLRERNICELVGFSFALQS